MKHSIDDLSFFRGFQRFWLAWVLFCCILSGAIISGVGYAIYWGLSLAERAVEVQESGKQMEIQPEVPADRS